MKTSIQFLAIPKFYEYPEDLELGIFTDSEIEAVVYHPAQNMYRVYRWENSYINFSLDIYWIYVNGHVIN